ncbi:MAG: tetratricopeptide repeat protein [Nitrospinae bacterium]|nr:tetratricopeptide repeat protein [Nitrospinota bacterium]
MTTPPASTAASLLRRWWPFLLVAVVAVGVFSNSFNNEFIYDDRIAIVENPYIRSWSNLWELINPTSTFHRTYMLLSWRPLQSFSYLATYMLFGLNAGPHHIFNVAFHALNAVLVFVILRRLTRHEAVALIGALAFAVHPIHIEAVQVSALRADLLSTPLFIAALLCHLRLRSRPGDKPLLWAGLAAAAYFFSCTAKEVGAILPLLALFLDARRHKLRGLLNLEGIRPYLGYAVAAALYGLLRFGIFSNVHQGDFYIGDTLLAAVLTTGRIFVYYIDHLLLPFDMRPDYVFAASMAPDLASLSSWALLASLAGVAWLARRRHPTLTLGLVWLGVTLLPVTNVVPIRNPMADRYLYLPSIGFSAIVGWALVEASRAAKQRWGVSRAGVLALLGAAVFIPWGAVTLKQNTVWRNNMNLWTETARLEPKSARAQYNLGVFSQRQDSYETAMAYYREAVRLAPGYGKANGNLGVLMALEGNNAEAEVFLKRAIALDRSDGSAYNNLGFFYYRQGLTKKAEPYYHEAIRLEPTFAKALDNLGTLLEGKGKYAEAEAAYLRAVAAKPEYTKAHLNLAVLYLKFLKTPEKALPHLEAIIRIKPDHPDIELIRSQARKLRGESKFFGEIPLLPGR